MSKKEVPNRQYTDEFKVEAVRLADRSAATRPQAIGNAGVESDNWVRLNRQAN